jgi:UDP-N-acetylglucosamine 2-epimerase (non-hydrolysing)
LKRLKKYPPNFPSSVARIASGPFVLVTAHRRENFGRPLEEVFEALRDVAKARPTLGFIYPVHPNPNVRAPARRILGGLANVCLTDPLDYGPLIHLLKKCLFVVTDSGGIQEEAPSLGKPVLVLRAVTERPEAVRAGAARLVGTDGAQVKRWIEKLLDDPAVYGPMARAVNPYGDGRAAARTAAALRHYFDPGCPRPDHFSPGA